MSGRAGFCGIDVGTQGVRTVVADAEGVLLGAGRRPLPSGRRVGRVHEQDTTTWVHAMLGALRDATGQLPSDVRVVSVALDATSGTVLVEDQDGAAVGPALMYDDARATSEAGRARTAGATVWDQLGYAMQTSWALPKVLWLLEHAALGAADRVVHQSDHLVRHLVGHQVPTDTSHALKTGADLRDASWPGDVFEELGLPVERLPGLVSPGSVLGHVSSRAARETGLPAGAEVRAGMTDGCAGQIAAGAMRPGSWSSTLGTTLVVKGSVEHQIHDPSGVVYCHRHPDGGWLPGGASSSGAGFFATALPGRDLDALTAEAVRRPPVPAVVYPLAGTGERFPFVCDQATGFADPGLDDTDHFIGICQGLGFVERLAYDVLGSLGADVSGPVALTGGATRNDWLNQLRTDIIGRPTTVPAQPGAAFGMAVLAAAEPGSLTATAERMVTVRERLLPDPERGAALQEGYARLVGRLAERGWISGSVAAGVLATSGGAT